MGFSKTGSAIKSAPLQNPVKRQKCALSKLQFENNPKNDLVHAGTKSETFMRPIGLPPRPSTRRHPYETPDSVQKTRSHSLGSVDKNSLIQKEIRPVKRRKQTKQKCLIKTKSNETSQDNCESRKLAVKDKNKKGSLSDRSEDIKSSKSKTNEHEYLQFVLRITEDIITNDYAENEDLLKLFSSHFEANRHRLDETKMELHLILLARELQIPYKNSLELPLDEDMLTTITEINKAAVVVDGDCECTSSKRVLDVKKILPSEYIFDNAEEGDVLLNTHSLSRVTECTEPTNSVDTIFNASSKFPSITTVSSFGNVDVLPGFENLDIQNKYVDMGLGDNKIRLADRFSNAEDFSVEVADQKSLIQHHEPQSEKINDKNCSLPIELNNDDHDSVELQKSDSSILKNEKQLIPCSETDTASGSDSSAKTVVKNDFNVPVCVIDTNRGDNDNQNLTNVTLSSHHLVDSISSKLIIDNNQDQDLITESTVKIAIDRSTQISLEHFEQNSISCSSNIKETVTEDEESEYVLISKPIYVLKKILESDEKLILIKETMSTTKEEVQLEEPVPLSNHCCDNENKNYSTENNFPQNINSDNRITFQEKKTEAPLTPSDGNATNQTQHVEKIQNSNIINNNNTDFNDQHYSDGSDEKPSHHKPLLCGEHVNNPVLGDLTYVESSGGKHFDLNRASASDNTLNLSDYSMKSMSSEIDAYFMSTKMNYSKLLLTSDYDMTPQRDHPSTDKYHHLLVDAATSISNVNIGNSSQNLLLTTEDYVIMPNMGGHQTGNWICHNCCDSSKYEKIYDTVYSSQHHHDVEDDSVASSRNNNNALCVCAREHGVDTCDIDKYAVEQEMRRSKTFLLSDAGGPTSVGRRFMRKTNNLISNVVVDVQSSSADSVYNSSIEQGRIHEEHCQTERSQIDCTTSTSGLA